MFFFSPFTNLEQLTLSLATDGRLGVEPRVGGSSRGSGSGDAREPTGNPCYRNPPS